MTIFLTMSLFLFLQEPYDMEYLKKDASIANIYMQNMKDYEISEDKITRITTSKESIKYKDRDILIGVRVLSYENDFIYDVKSNLAEHQDDIITLKDYVVIKRNDNTVFRSNEISYDRLNNKIFCDTYFEIKNPNYYARGEGFTYDLDKKSIIANQINVDYEMEKK